MANDGAGIALLALVIAVLALLARADEGDVDTPGIELGAPLRRFARRRR